MVEGVVTVLTSKKSKQTQGDAVVKSYIESHVTERIDGYPRNSSLTK